jgi:hypothetical protein
MPFYVDPDKVAFRVTNGEAVLIQTDTSYYYGLNPVGTFVWERLAEARRTPEELVLAVSREFDQTPSTVQADVLNLLAELKKEGLVGED